MSRDNHMQDNRVASELAALPSLNVEQLRERWRLRFGGEPPALRSGDLLRRLYAERVQTETLGGDAELERQLQGLVRTLRRGGALTPAHGKVREGAVFVREYDGVAHRVEATADGFHWQGRAWKSLSQIAREITGVRWNGPRFFGLRAEPATP